MNLKNLSFGLMKQKFLLLPDNVRAVIVLSSVLTLILVVKVINKASAEKPKEDTNIDQTIDTVIPNGFVLVPIEISNIESIAPLIGSQAVVDLYKFNEKGKSSKVISKVKVLRAPYNPSVYAVLVPDSQSASLMKDTNPFYAVVQNEKVTGTQVLQRKLNKISISYSN